MANIFLTSDHHFGHANIITYSNRPFANTEEMDWCLVDKWNAVVKPEDHVYHLGDVTMARKPAQEGAFINICRQLNGHKRLILGNHDHFPVETYVKAGFDKIVGTGCWLGRGWILSHYPIHPSNLGFNMKACIHGHTHSAPDFPPVVRDEAGKRVVLPYINICVERTDYEPIHVDNVEQRINAAIAGARP